MLTTAGTQALWVVNCRQETITVHLADGTARIYGAGQTIEGGDLFPGLTVSLDQVFRKRRSPRQD